MIVFNLTKIFCNWVILSQCVSFSGINKCCTCVENGANNQSMCPIVKCTLLLFVLSLLHKKRFEIRSLRGGGVLITTIILLFIKFYSLSLSKPGVYMGSSFPQQRVTSFLLTLKLRKRALCYLKNELAQDNSITGKTRRQRGER